MTQLTLKLFSEGLFDFGAQDAKKIIITAEPLTPLFRRGGLVRLAEASPPPLGQPVPNPPPLPMVTKLACLNFSQRTLTILIYSIAMEVIWSTWTRH